MASARSTKTTDAPGIDLPSIEEATERIRNLNERIIESSKKAGGVTLDAYEKALQSMVDFEERLAASSRLDWVSSLASTHARFLSDVSKSYTTAARDLLK